MTLAKPLLEAAKESNKIRIEDAAAHDWYRFVLSFPPHLVRASLERLGLGSGSTILDPFCGTGTTLVECKKNGVTSIGVERNPMAHFASQVKVAWNVEPEDLVEHARRVAEFASDKLDRVRANGFRTLPLESEKLLLKNSISPVPLHKTLVLLDAMKEMADSRFSEHERLALAKTVVLDASNLHFGPEVGIGDIKSDAPVVDRWLRNVFKMADDLAVLGRDSRIKAEIHYADARCLSEILKPNSVDGVVTSPPYPNEKDYTRTTRLESVLLGFLCTKEDLRSVKKGLVCSNTRNVYKSATDDAIVAGHKELTRIANAIEHRRVLLGKTSGFERMYARVTKLYFGGLSRHLRDIRIVLRPGARLAYVVGDQASYLRVMIRTGQLLADIAQSLGYRVVNIDLFRTRLATATREQLREEIVFLEWPGGRLKRGVLS